MMEACVRSSKMIKLTLLGSALGTLGCGGPAPTEPVSQDEFVHNGVPGTSSDGPPAHTHNGGGFLTGFLIGNMLGGGRTVVNNPNNVGFRSTPPTAPSRSPTSPPARTGGFGKTGSPVGG
jgi:hypothetical protein